MYQKMWRHRCIIIAASLYNKINLIMFWFTEKVYWFADNVLIALAKVSHIHSGNNNYFTSIAFGPAMGSAAATVRQKPHSTIMLVACRSARFPNTSRHSLEGDWPFASSSIRRKPSDTCRPSTRCFWFGSQLNIHSWSGHCFQFHSSVKFRITIVNTLVGSFYQQCWGFIYWCFSTYCVLRIF